ncbi:hypothetical protein SAMN05421866_1237 [Chryseobacterium oranimense]|uniref:C1q domain-containing protein n=1 Tax=Chryseobacterium oranimense TaxID=421058 RepID=A0A1M5LW12_9FLAO|nr:hypothetical protein [Chryseobacterium oranimense]CEJ70987.1 hypothetical protein BN1195_03326 [Chryseobacterium oranimense G311]SHG69247.1 hypothetical protein SAMN05421866_1237 [Chryseobacterium oranimense]
MKNIFSLLLLAGLGTVSYAQVLTNQPTNATITNSNVLLDGSTNFSTEAGAQPYVGKGVIIPSVDLVNFQFDLTLADSVTFPTYFDGMIVYNNATGNTLTTGNRSSTSTAVTPGYYFFYNPNGASNGNVTSGVWRPLGGGSAKFDVTSAETATNTLVASKQVYAIKGTFAATGSSTAVNIPAPTGMTALYGITIYKAGTNTVYDRSLYSYTIATTAGNAITGSPSMSVVYPAGTYDYVIEYLK